MNTPFSPAAAASADAGPLDRLVAFFEALTPATVAGLTEYYAADALFKDPFNEIRGHAAIVSIFAHMFQQLQAPRFIVIDKVAQGGQAFITWELHFRFAGRSVVPQVIRGASHLRFDAAGKVALHRDYWDAAEELYEKLPMLGGFMRWLKRAANR